MNNLEFPPNAVDEFRRARLYVILVLRHPMVVLGKRVPWLEIEAGLLPALTRKGRTVPLSMKMICYARQRN